MSKEAGGYVIDDSRVALKSNPYEKGGKVHNCPICGEETEGAISEGGVEFVICEGCYERRYKAKPRIED